MPSRTFCILLTKICVSMTCHHTWNVCSIVMSFSFIWSPFPFSNLPEVHNTVESHFNLWNKSNDQSHSCHDQLVLPQGLSPSLTYSPRLVVRKTIARIRMASDKIFGKHTVLAQDLPIFAFSGNQQIAIVSATSSIPWIQKGREWNGKCSLEERGLVS